MEAMFDWSPNIGSTRPSKYPKQNPMFSTFTIFGLYLEGVLLKLHEIAEMSPDFGPDV